MLSWASLGGGMRRADTILNHQVMLDDRADVRMTAYAMARRGDWAVGAWCTAGCSNALRIGDPATAGMAPGTINLAVVINQNLSWTAMAEAFAMAAEARVAAVQEAGILSTRTNRPATGTGTDCIVVASSSRSRAHQYCGKHTLLGELIGKAALRSCTRALRVLTNAPLANTQSH
jgi:adenosylcobinamide amidohydrolase